MGDNDDNLQWPFSNRFIRLAVVDQASNTVERMSQSNNFVSSETNSAWQKPTSVSICESKFYHLVETLYSGIKFSRHASVFPRFKNLLELLSTRHFQRNKLILKIVQLTRLT